MLRCTVAKIHARILSTAVKLVQDEAMVSVNVGVSFQVKVCSWLVRINHIMIWAQIDLHVLYQKSGKIR